MEFWFLIYQGQLKPNSRTARKTPRYPIKYWNLHERVLNSKQSTTNKVENWHSKISPDARNNMTVGRAISLFQLEQNRMEVDLVKHLSGSRKKKRSADTIKEEKIFELVKNYKTENIESFLRMMSLNMGDKR